MSAKWNTSVVIALIAVLISSASALISLKESRILMQQQETLAQQNEASVWPYLEKTSFINVTGEEVINYSCVITNKGVGPAIIDSVDYLYGGKNITPWGLYEEIKKEHPDVLVSAMGNTPLGNRVLAPGESHTVVKIQLRLGDDKDVDLNHILNQLPFQLEFCYCSVYGKCWRVNNAWEINPSSACTFRQNIR